MAGKWAAWVDGSGRSPRLGHWAADGSQYPMLTLVQTLILNELWSLQVEHREDGKNVNNWHWTSTSKLAWSKERLGELLSDLTANVDPAVASLKITGVKAVTGEVRGSCMIVSCVSCMTSRQTCVMALCVCHRGGRRLMHVMALCVCLVSIVSRQKLWSC